MDDAFLAELSAWLTQAGLAGTSEIEIVSGFCDRCVAAGLPVARALLFVDTLHPVHEGRLLRWGYGPTESPLLEYGRTSPDALAASGSEFLDVDAARGWRKSPHYRMLQTGDSFLRRRLDITTKDEFPVFSEFLAAGMTDYVAIISRFAPEGVIGEMDGVYSSWATSAADGFSNDQIAALQQLAPYLALAIKSVSLARMTGTLMETYLGRGAGQWNHVGGCRRTEWIAEQRWIHRVDIWRRRGIANRRIVRLPERVGIQRVGIVSVLTKKIIRRSRWERRAAAAFGDILG